MANSNDMDKLFRTRKAERVKTATDPFISPIPRQTAVSVPYRIGDSLHNFSLQSRSTRIRTNSGPRGSLDHKYLKSLKGTAVAVSTCKLKPAKAFGSTSITTFKGSLVAKNDVDCPPGLVIKNSQSNTTKSTATYPVSEDDSTMVESDSITMSIKASPSSKARIANPTVTSPVICLVGDDNFDEGETTLVESDFSSKRRHVGTRTTSSTKEPVLERLGKMHDGPLAENCPSNYSGDVQKLSSDKRSQLRRQSSDDTRSDLPVAKVFLSAVDVPKHKQPLKGHKKPLIPMLSIPEIDEHNHSYSHDNSLVHDDDDGRIDVDTVQESYLNPLSCDKPNLDHGKLSQDYCNDSVDKPSLGCLDEVFNFITAERNRFVAFHEAGLTRTNGLRSSHSGEMIDSNYCTSQKRSSGSASNVSMSKSPSRKPGALRKAKTHRRRLVQQPQQSPIIPPGGLVNLWKRRPQHIYHSPKLRMTQIRGSGIHDGDIIDSESTLRKSSNSTPLDKQLDSMSSISFHSSSHSSDSSSLIPPVSPSIGEQIPFKFSEVARNPLLSLSAENNDSSGHCDPISSSSASPLTPPDLVYSESADILLETIEELLLQEGQSQPTQVTESEVVFEKGTDTGVGMVGSAEIKEAIETYPLLQDTVGSFDRTDNTAQLEAESNKPQIPCHSDIGDVPLEAHPLQPGIFAKDKDNPGVSSGQTVGDVLITILIGWAQLPLMNVDDEPASISEHLTIFTRNESRGWYFGFDTYKRPSVGWPYDMAIYHSVEDGIPLKSTPPLHPHWFLSIHHDWGWISRQTGSRKLFCGKRKHILNFLDSNVLSSTSSHQVFSNASSIGMNGSNVIVCHNYNHNVHIGDPSGNPSRDELQLQIQQLNLKVQNLEMKVAINQRILLIENLLYHIGSPTLDSMDKRFPPGPEPPPDRLSDDHHLNDDENHPPCSSDSHHPKAHAHSHLPCAQHQICSPSTFLSYDDPYYPPELSLESSSLKHHSRGHYDDYPRSLTDRNHLFDDSRHRRRFNPYPFTRSSGSSKVLDHLSDDHHLNDDENHCPYSLDSQRYDHPKTHAHSQLPYAQHQICSPSPTSSTFLSYDDPYYPPEPSLKSSSLKHHSRRHYDDYPRSLTDRNRLFNDSRHRRRFNPYPSTHSSGSSKVLDDHTHFPFHSDEYKTNK